MDTTKENRTLIERIEALESTVRCLVNSLTGSVQPDFGTVHASSLPPGEAPATERQKSFAEAIAMRLHIPLPEEPGKKQYREFISRHIDAFRRKAYLIDCGEPDRDDGEYTFEECC